MEESSEGESTAPPFWIQPSSAARRRRLSSGVLLFTLSITVSLFLFVFLLSLSSPQTHFKRSSWDSLNLALLLLPLLFALFTRTRNGFPDGGIRNNVGKNWNRSYDKGDEGVRGGWGYEFLDRRDGRSHDPAVETEDGRDGGGIGGNAARKGNGWYGYSERRDEGVGLSRDGSRDPGVETENGRDGGGGIGARKRNESVRMSGVRKGDEGVRGGWYEFLDRRDGRSHDPTVGTENGREGEIGGNVGKKGNGWVKYSDWTVGLGGNRSHDPTVETENGRDGGIRRNMVKNVSGWYEYSDRKDEVGLGGNRSHDPTVESDNRMNGEIGKNVVNNRSGWYEYSDRTAVIGLKRSHSSYPDLREISATEDSGDRWRFHDDTSVDAHSRGGESWPEGELKNRVYTDESVKGEAKSVNNGTVIGVGEGIARVRGLEGVTEGEIVEFDEGIIGIVTNSENNENVGVLLMGDGLRVQEGSCVKATGKIAHVPASLGHVEDVSAKPIDGGDEIKEMPPAVRRRRRRISRSDGNKGKSSEELSGMEPPHAKSSHRRTKSSGVEPSGEKIRHRKTKSSEFERFGTVLLVGKGIARIYGLDEVTAGEIVEFEEGTIGIVMNSESVNNVGVVLMGDGLLIQEGSRVKATGKIAQIPVPEAYLGSVINSLAKPIDDKIEISTSETREKREIKQVPPSVRRRTRRAAGSDADKGKPSEEVSGLEQLSRRKTKRTHEESVIPKVEGKDELEPELEPNEYESSPEMSVQYAPYSPPPRSEKKSVTREFLMSLRMKKKKQKSIENLDILPESPPPSPPPHPSKSFFSSKKEKGKKVITVPAPPLLPIFTAAREQKSAPVASPAAMRRPPLPERTRGFIEERARESTFSGAESPLHPIPSPPPPPPFTMPSWKFVVKGDYVRIGSVNSSRSGSPEPEEADSSISNESGGADVAMGTMFCPSPDVNSKADMFIAKFRAGLKLQKMNSMKQKQGVGLSNLGPASTLDQAQA